MNLSLAHVSLCAALTLLPGNVAARSKATVEQVAVLNIMSAMTLFAHVNDNRHPTNWAQVAQVIDLSQINKSLISSPARPLEAHYVFIRERTIPMLGYQEGEVVLIRIGPVTEEERPGAGRYIISRVDGDLKCSWYAERKVQQMLAQAGVKELPQPEVVAPTSSRAITPSSVTWAAVALVVVISFGLACVFLRRSRKRA